MKLEKFLILWDFSAYAELYTSNIRSMLGHSRFTSDKTSFKLPAECFCLKLSIIHNNILQSLIMDCHTGLFSCIPCNWTVLGDISMTLRLVVVWIQKTKCLFACVLLNSSLCFSHLIPLLAKFLSFHSMNYHWVIN